jgi:phosphoribosylamine-glycine ligase
MDDSLAFCRELVALGHPFVIEEKLEGEEFSYFCFCDGHVQASMPAVQDHKRAYDGDTGPNTGGMGTYSDADHKLPFLTADDLRQAQNINNLVAKALEEECGAPYQGILYGGFMVTKDGVKLIEYNARFGDPEGKLATCDIAFQHKASVCKYVVPEGYPDAPLKGDAVMLPNELPKGVSVFLSAVDLRDGELVATGSRTVAFVGIADTLAEAEASCAQAVKQVPGRFFHRTDIGTAAAIARRVDHMIALRSA